MTNFYLNVLDFLFLLFNQVRYEYYSSTSSPNWLGRGLKMGLS